MDHTITFQVDMPQDQAWALAQLLKRITYRHCLGLAENSHEAYEMLYATERLRKAMAEAGIAPR